MNRCQESRDARCEDLEKRLHAALNANAAIEGALRDALAARTAAQDEAQTLTEALRAADEARSNAVRSALDGLERLGHIKAAFTAAVGAL